MIELRSDKVVYRPKDDINLTVMVKNDEVSDDIFIYGDMGFGYSASSPFSDVTRRVGTHYEDHVKRYRPIPALSKIKDSKEKR